jgi:hypothetical protein
VAPIDDDYWRDDRSIIRPNSTCVGELRPWMTAELAKENGNCRALWQRLKDTDLEIAEWCGTSTFVFAPTGPGTADYIQISLGREVEWRRNFAIRRGSIAMRPPRPTISAVRSTAWPIATPLWFRSEVSWTDAAGSSASAARPGARNGAADYPAAKPDGTNEELHFLSASRLDRSCAAGGTVFSGLERFRHQR